MDVLLTLPREIGYQLIEAAIPYRPEWLIQTVRRQAEDIMDRGKAVAYQTAVEWLRQARTAYMRTAYIQSGQQAEWQCYRAQLMSTHGRKYKLMGLIKAGNLE
ncbi:hypothetical protein DO97_19895 [Neosynechococcus sphagnicola sy1]|uniref:Uncharacterized protein n=1 Tax=Neosynechococcus sphagnicola sy1 TaxID=1497020 RepID=A0A098TRE7_9CYAN|nr:hypothetical protein [Neosynechococcus sphagnicola]KGF73368.1 hypothetical protein DO97_19895 [Neosynechococcus sphagnicola sy1]